MTLFNSEQGYGAATRLFHWLIAILFAGQLAAGLIMTRLGPGGSVAGIGEAHWYNWHKSLGLVALVIAVLRLLNRRVGTLPPWAPTLGEGEKRFIHRAEQILYAAMLVMPLSGFVTVMAGGFGVHLFSTWHLPNPIGVWPGIAGIARVVHQVAAIALYGTILGHIGLVLDVG